MVNVYERVEANKRKSWLVMILFLIFVVGAAYLMAKGLGYGPGVVGWALVFSGVLSFISYYFSDRIILALSSAREASREKDFEFYTVAENLSTVARIPLPKLYVVEDTALNAFATGRDPKHAVVVATSGLLAKLNRTQLKEGLMGFCFGIHLAQESFGWAANELEDAINIQNPPRIALRQFQLLEQHRNSSPYSHGRG